MTSKETRSEAIERITKAHDKDRDKLSRFPKALGPKIRFLTAHGHRKELLTIVRDLEKKMCGGLAMGGHDDCHASKFKKTIRDLERENSELRDFTAHKLGCAWFGGFSVTKRVCSCGLNKILKQESENG